MASSPTCKSHHYRPARSVSLPFESNPIVQRVTRELSKLKKWEEESSTNSATETLSIGLCGATDLYKCIGDVLSLPMTQQALSLHQHRQCVHDILDGAEKLVQLCTASKDLTLQLNEASRDLRSSLFQEKQHAQLSVSSYISSRRQIAKEAKHLLSSLKRMECESFCSSKALEGDDDHRRLSAVTNMLRCVGIITISILESLLMFLETPVSKPTTNSRKFGIVSRIMNKSKAECRDNHQAEEGGNELKNVYSALCVLPSSGTTGVSIDEVKVQLVCKRLEALEVGLEEIQNGLDSVSRRLVMNRASLLEIFSL